MINPSPTPEVMKKFKPFLDDVLAAYEEGIDSIHITGSALTKDFDPKTSDVNSVMVLKTMSLEFLTILAPLGKKYGKKKIAAPLIMTPQYIQESLDVFPIEFLNFQLLHHTILGEDVFQHLEIKKSDLRYQCERELKVRLIGLRQGYISAVGNQKIITENFINAIAAYIPLFRSIIFLLGNQPPLNNNDVLTALQEATDVNTDAFETVLRAKRDRKKLPMEKLNTLFQDHYAATERLGEIINGIAL